MMLESYFYNSEDIFSTDLKLAIQGDKEGISRDTLNLSDIKLSSSGGIFHLWIPPVG